MAEQDFGPLQVFLFSFPPERLALFKLREASMEGGLEFAEPVSKFHHPRSRPLLCFITNGKGVLDYLAVGHRGEGGGTGLSQLELNAVHTVTQQILLSRLLYRIPGRFFDRVDDAFKQAGLVSLKASHEILNVLLAEYPPAQSVIDSAVPRRANPLINLSKENQFAFQQQKDAVLVSLQLADIDRKEHLTCDFDLSRPPKSFLEGLPQVRLREVAMLENDFQILPGFERFGQFVRNAARFSNGITNLTVMLIHEQPLEGLVGSDLIYYHENLKSFVMVQYKAMEEEGSEQVFRLPNKDLAREVCKMVAFTKELQKIACKDPTLPGSYRLNQNPFFLKFCPRVVRQPDDIELIPGMYLPLDYWLCLETSSNLDGERGGKLLRFDNVGRWFNNTTFANFVSQGWMGTHADQSVVIQRVIRETLKTGRAITLAQAQTLPPESEAS